MTDRLLPAPPRRLSKPTARLLSWGHPYCLLGAMLLMLASPAVWLLLAGYGVTFSEVRASWRSVEILLGTVTEVAPVRLPTGETVYVVEAGGQNLKQEVKAKGFLPRGEFPSLGPGDEVELSLPAGMSQGWLTHHDRFPIDTTYLAQLLVVLLSPGLLFLVVGLFAGQRNRALLTSGLEISARVKRSLGLPRPFSDLALLRCELQLTPGRLSEIWTLGPKEGSSTTVMVGRPRILGVAPLAWLLPEVRVEDGCVAGGDSGLTFRFRTTVVLLAVVLSPWALYLAT